MLIVHRPAWERYSFIKNKINRLAICAHNRVRRPCKRWDTPMTTAQANGGGSIGDRHAVRQEYQQPGTAGQPLIPRDVFLYLYAEVNRTGLCGVSCRTP